MGLLDLFKKGGNEKTRLHPEITLSEIDNGSHGDNIGGLIGFNTLNQESGKKFINEYIALSMTNQADLSSQSHELRSSSLLASTSNFDDLRLRVITDTKKVISAFPYLKTTYKIPFATKEIIEWKHVNGCEAEIKGGGRDTFGFDFFPTDYAVNRSKYLQIKNFELYVSAIAFVVDESIIENNSEVPFSEDFVSYLPSSNLPRQTYYDFIGKVVNFKTVSLNNLNDGYWPSLVSRRDGLKYYYLTF